MGEPIQFRAASESAWDRDFGQKFSEWLRGEWEAAQYGGEQLFCRAMLEFASMIRGGTPPLCFESVCCGRH